MTLSIKHKFQTAKADGPDSSLVKPSNWNDTHDILVATGVLVGRGAASAGAAEEVTPDVNYFTMSTGAMTLKSAWLSTLALKDNQTHTGTTKFANAVIDGTAGTTRPLDWDTGGVLRWRLAANSTTESGSNAGSNLTLGRYQDNGSLVDLPLTVTRSTGVFNFLQRPQFNGSDLATVSQIPSTAGFLTSTSFGVAVASAAAVGSTGVITKSVGITSITRTTTGTYNVVLSSTQPDTDYHVIGSSSSTGAGRTTHYVYAKTTSGFTINVDNGSSSFDPTQLSFMIFRPS